MTKKEKSFQPMLASNDAPDLDAIKYPVYGSPKLDGIRCFMHPELGAVSRNLKPIRNDYIRSALNSVLESLAGMDGELITTNGPALDDFNTVQSKVMSQLGMPAFVLKVFDLHNADPSTPYEQRYDAAKRAVERDEVQCFNMGHHNGMVSLVTHKLLPDRAALEKCEAAVVCLGYEGLMIRSPFGPYKYGRSTLKEGYLLKIKRFEDAEAEIVEVLEEMHNANEAFTDEVGRTKRSKHKEGMVPAGRVGKFVCKWDRGPDFEVGTFNGVTQETRRLWWEGRSVFRFDGMNRIKFKFQGIERERPRFPVFLGFREGDE